MLPEEQERLMEKEYGITQLTRTCRGISILLRPIDTDILNHCDVFARMMLSDLVADNKRGSKPSREIFQQSPPCFGLMLLRRFTQLASNREKLLEHSSCVLYEVC